jgi:hypothetical protein
MKEKKPEKLVTIASFTHPLEAHLAKTKLASVDIESFLADEHIASLDLHYSNVVGGIKLKVDVSAVERAASVLGLEDVHLEEEINRDYNGPVCIMCNSRDVRHSGLLSLLASFFKIPFVKKRWECERCGHRWEE